LDVGGTDPLGWAVSDFAAGSPLGRLVNFNGGGVLVVCGCYFLCCAGEPFELFVVPRTPSHQDGKEIIVMIFMLKSKKASKTDSAYINA